MPIRSSRSVAITVFLGVTLAACIPGTTGSKMVVVDEATAYPTSTPYPTDTAQPKASTIPLASLEQVTELPDATVSIDKVVVTAPTEVISEHLAVYTDPQTEISLNYPADWELEEHEHGVVFIGPEGDIDFHIMNAPFDELEEIAEEVFSEYDYLEETRLVIDDPSGYLSIGQWRDGASHARVIVGDEEVGLIMLGATSDPGHFEQHLAQFQTILASLNLL